MPLSLVNVTTNIKSIYLADIYDSSISNGVFLEKLKQQKCPLLKSGTQVPE